MSKFSSLILLINSLSKSERKKISSTLNLSDDNTDYLFLYKLINKHPINSQDIIKEEFTKKRPGSALNTSVNYLFDTLISILSQLRTNQDSFFTLFNLLMNAKVLFEKSLYHECFQLLIKVQNEAMLFEKYNILLVAQKMELDYLLILDFPGISEQELLNKQYEINNTLKKIRKINEHASLYEILRYRILHKGAARSNKQKQELSDLVVSEMSIVSNSNFENFEIKKNHKLFQANYLINVGDYKSALFSLYELNKDYEQNRHLFSNPPIYYLMTIEGILESLRAIKNYAEMSYFIAPLEAIETSSNQFKIQIQYVVNMYKLVSLIDTGRFNEAKAFIDGKKEALYNKIDMLIPARKAKLLLNIALVYLGTKEFTKAHKVISQIMMNGKNIFSLPLFRTIRLVNLMILYELKEFDYIESEVRSFKHEIQNKERIYQIETLMLKFINKPIDGMSQKDRLQLWAKISPELSDIQNNKYERQLLRIFDFTVWVESKIRNIPLDKLLMDKI